MIIHLISNFQNQKSPKDSHHNIFFVNHQPFFEHPKLLKSSLFEVWLEQKMHEILWLVSSLLHNFSIFFFYRLFAASGLVSYFFSISLILVLQYSSLSQ